MDLSSVDFKSSAVACTTLLVHNLFAKGNPLFWTCVSWWDQLAEGVSGRMKNDVRLFSGRSGHL